MIIEICSHVEGIQERDIILIENILRGMVNSNEFEHNTISKVFYRDWILKAYRYKNKIFIIKKF